MPFNLILMGCLAAAPFVVFGAMAVREKLVVAGAVKAERTVQAAQCETRVTGVARAASAAVAAAAADAREAAEAVGLTPESAAEIAALCKKSASCRSRGDLK